MSNECRRHRFLRHGSAARMAFSYRRVLGVKANQLPERTLVERAKAGGGDNELRVEQAVTAHMRNWMECVRSKRRTVADLETGYNHSVAPWMAMTALHGGKRVIFDTQTKEIISA